jgi:hypothetical protein
MKHYFPLPTFIFCIFLGTNSYAEPDYNEIRKNIKVMNKIITTAIETDEDCERCRASIKGSYLAGQGALFVVSPRRASLHEVLVADGDWEFGDIEELESLEGLPEMVGNIVADVAFDIGEAVDDLGAHDNHAIRITRHQDSRSDQRSLERQLRTLQREQRELNNDIREKQIDLVRAEDDTRAEFESALEKLESEARKLEADSEAIREQLNEKRREKTQQRAKVKAEAAVKRQQRNALIESSVLNILCDYGGALKSLPKDERITVLFENDGKDWVANKTKVYVTNKIDLLSCQAGDLDRDALVERAIVYNF